MYTSAATYEKASYERQSLIDLNDDTYDFYLGVNSYDYEYSDQIFIPYSHGDGSADITARIYVSEGDEDYIDVELYDLDSYYSRTKSLTGYRTTLTWNDLIPGHRYRFRVENSASSYAYLRFMLL